MILIVHLLTWHEFTALCGGTCNKVFNKVLGRSLRACCRLISLAGREFTTGSNNLLWKTKIWGNFEVAVEQKSLLD